MAVLITRHEILVGGVNYYLQGNIKKQGKRLQEFFQNKIGLRYIIVDPTYSFGSTYLSDWVALYIRGEDWASDTFTKWWRDTIEPIREE